MNSRRQGSGEQAGAVQSFGPELRRLRLAQGTSQAALSRAVHYSNAYLCKVENGQKPPTADLARRCDDALGTGGALTALLTVAPVSRRQAGPPAQLPAGIPDFTGRTGQLARLDALSSGAEGTLAIVAITGAAGVGKTALAVHWGHRLAGQATDGQLYVNMRGDAAATALRPAEALSQFLRALGVPAERIPGDVEEAAGLYRSMLAGRRMLVVLDNVASSQQVRPLLPGSGGCTVIITSRDRLTGLAATHGVGRLALDVLPSDEAIALLARLVGPARIAAEPGQAAELVGLCSGLPLALRIAAANLSDDQARYIGAYVEQLRSGDPFSALEVTGDEQTGVRSAFGLAYQALDPAARTMFRLLGLMPGADISVEAAAALAGTTMSQRTQEHQDIQMPAGPPAAEAVLSAAALLGRLDSAHLVEEHAPGRFAMHDLLRQFASGLTGAGHDAEDVAAARLRLLGYYLRSADKAAKLISPDSVRIAVPDDGTGWPATAAGFGTAAEAMSWIDAERSNLVAIARQAAASGPHDVAWLLAEALHGYFWLRRHTADWQAVTAAGLAAAQLSGGEHCRASAHWRLADVQLSAGRYDQAIAGYRQAADLATRAGWPEVEGAALGNLGMLYRERGLLAQAVDCHTASLAIAERDGRTASQAANLSNLGIAYLELGELDRAAGVQERALQMHVEAGSKLRTARTMLNLAMVYHQLGRWDEAEELLVNALPGHREAADPVGEAHSRNSLAALYCDRGRFDRARGEAMTAITAGRQTGDRTVEADSLIRLGVICVRRQQHHEGLALYRQAMALAAEIGLYPEAEALIGLALCCAGLGRVDEADGYAGRAISVAQEAGFRLLAGQALVAAACVRLATGAADHAADLATRAIEIQAGTGCRLGQAQALTVVALASRAAGRDSQARRHLAEATSIAAAIGAPESASHLALPERTA
jgi:tetratricopeptide (TPR) repeat protein